MTAFKCKFPWRHLTHCLTWIWRKSPFDIHLFLSSSLLSCKTEHPYSPFFSPCTVSKVIPFFANLNSLHKWALSEFKIHFVNIIEWMRVELVDLGLVSRRLNITRRQQRNLIKVVRRNVNKEEFSMNFPFMVLCERTSAAVPGNVWSRISI